jgi:hypothetical protein
MSAASKGWRDVVPIHPAADLLPPMSPDALRELRSDIKKNGLRLGPVMWRAEEGAPALLVDGRSRLDATEVEGLPILDDEGKPFCAEIAKRCKYFRGGDPYDLVLSLNLHRRHLTAKQKREVIEKVLKAQPQKSNRTIAKQTRADHKTVGVVRRRLQQRGEIPHVSSREDTKGRKQPATRMRVRIADPTAAVEKRNLSHTAVPEEKFDKAQLVTVRWRRDADGATIARTILVKLKDEPHAADLSALISALHGVSGHNSSTPQVRSAVDREVRREASLQGNSDSVTRRPQADFPDLPPELVRAPTQRRQI